MALVMLPNEDVLIVAAGFAEIRVIEQTERLEPELELDVVSLIGKFLNTEKLTSARRGHAGCCGRRCRKR